MSAKGDLLDALNAYTRELHGTPGVEDLKALCQELSTAIDHKPDPTPSHQPPPFHGQSTSSAPSNGQSPNWPAKGDVVIQIKRG